MPMHLFVFLASMFGTDLAETIVVPMVLARKNRELIARTKFRDARTTQPMSWQGMQLLGDQHEDTIQRGGSSWGIPPRVTTWVY